MRSQTSFFVIGTQWWASPEWSYPLRDTSLLWRDGKVSINYVYTQCSEHYDGSRSISRTQSSRDLHLCVWWAAFPEAAHGPRCSAFYGSAVQGTMLQAGNLALCTLCISQVKITFISHLCFLVLIKRPSLSLRLIRKTVWGPFLWSGVKLWLCLHLSSEACIRPHLPKALWLTFRDSLICTNNVKMGIVCWILMSSQLSQEILFACLVMKLGIGFQGLLCQWNLAGWAGWVSYWAL